MLCFSAVVMIILSLAILDTGYWTGAERKKLE
jgi:hypothetical protein